VINTQLLYMKVMTFFIIID